MSSVSPSAIGGRMPPPRYEALARAWAFGDFESSDARDVEQAQACAGASFAGPSLERPRFGSGEGVDAGVVLVSGVGCVALGCEFLSRLGFHACGFGRDLAVLG